MYGTFFLGKNPHGKFFVTNNATNVAQQLADETGTEFYEIVDEADKVSLTKCALQKGAEKPAKVEIKTLVVGDESVKVQTSSQAEKKRIRNEAEALANSPSAQAEKDEG